MLVSVLDPKRQRRYYRPFCGGSMAPIREQSKNSTKQSPFIVVWSSCRGWNTTVNRRNECLQFLLALGVFQVLWKGHLQWLRLLLFVPPLCEWPCFVFYGPTC